MKLIRRFTRCLRAFFAPSSKELGLQIVTGDSLPLTIPQNTIILARDGDEDWCVGFLCPCGCGTTIELLLVPEATPRWSINVDRDGLVSLFPSVWLDSGCRSHFWVKRGKIEWCESFRRSRPPRPWRIFELLRFRRFRK